MKYLIWHTPRVGSNLLCNVLSQTQKAGIADYINCGFPLGAQGRIERNEFPNKLLEYEQKQTTHNGNFACKLSWEVLHNLVGSVGVDLVYEWLDTIDFHVYLYRQDTIAQAVSFYIASKRKFFSTTAQDNGVDILPTPPYDYNEIAFRRMKIERDNAAIKTFFEDYKIAPIYLNFESMRRSVESIRESARVIVRHLGIDTECLDKIDPQIRQQSNAKKEHYKNNFLLEWDEK